MRKLAVLITAAFPVVAPLSAMAEQVVLRIEAKRGPETQAVVDGWAAKFPNVVTFPAPGGWTAIAIGPMERADAEAEMARLKATREIPADSFIAPAPENVTAVTGAVAPEAAVPATPANPAAAASTFVPPSGADATAPSVEAEQSAEAPEIAEQPVETAEPVAEPAPVVPQGDYLRLQRLESRELADEALEKWRKDFPEVGMWEQSDGAFNLTLGPMPVDVAEAWLAAFRKAERVGRPGAVMPAAELGIPVIEGSDPKLPGPGTAEMPPLEDIQRALRWAGHYEGKIDGKDGPQTQAAIAAEVIALRAAPDAASAMQALIERREAWRRDMGLTQLDDPQSGLSVTAPMDKLEFDRNEQGLSIYGPKDGSGAALILYSAPGGQQEMLDFTGLVTALGWVPSPERQITQGHASLKGRNDTHIGQAEARIVDGQVEGLVVIWPVMDEEDQPRVAAELIDSMMRTPAKPEPAAEGVMSDPATSAPAVPEGAASDAAAQPVQPGSTPNPTAD